MPKQRKTPQVRIVAMTLAHEMADAVDADPEHRDGLVATALAVGEWLAETGHPGRWDLVDAHAVLAMLAIPDPVEVDGFLLTLAGLLGYAAFQEQLAPADARRALLQIADLTGNPAVKNFAAQTAATLRETVALAG